MRPHCKDSWQVLGNRRENWEDSRNSLTAATSSWDASWQSRVLKEGSEVESEERSIQQTTGEDNDQVRTMTFWAALCTNTLQECGNEQGQAVYVKAGC